jgi:hypothetical protein
MIAPANPARDPRPTLRPFLKERLALLSSVVTSEQRAVAAADLARYMKEVVEWSQLQVRKERPTPWVAPIEKLASGKPEERWQAATYLQQLVSLSLNKYPGGRMPWRMTMNWDIVFAYDLRREVADGLAQNIVCPEVVPLLRWYLENSPEDDILNPVIRALGNVHGRAADELRADLVLGAHPNATVVASAIRQITERKQTIPAENLARLCHNPRPSIREAARSLTMQQGGKDPGLFDTAKAICSEPMAKLMDELIALMPELPPANAEFVRVTVRYLDKAKIERGKEERFGWLLRNDGNAVEIHMPSGKTRAFRHGETTVWTQYNPRVVDFTVVTEVIVAPADPAELVKTLAKAPRRSTWIYELWELKSEPHMFRTRAPTAYEAIVAAWFYRAGKYKLAAEVLMPFLNEFDKDEILIEYVQAYLGEVYGYRMLEAYVGDWDYSRALGNAQLVLQLYPGSRFHGHAVRLARELPRRMDDFITLQLPTPAEWAVLKTKLTREQQIDFLCERFRLNRGHAQYAEPPGLYTDNGWWKSKGQTSVIHPWVELTSLNLTLKDAQTLTKHLREDWCTHAISFTSDFLGSTQMDLAGLIDSLAERKLCRQPDWCLLTPAQIDREIDRINRWIVENAVKSRAQRRWEVLQEDVSAGFAWFRIAESVHFLLTQKYTAVYDVMKSYLENGLADSWERVQILELFAKHDAQRAKEVGLSLLSDKDMQVRYRAAVLVARGGERALARQALGDVLADMDLSSQLQDGVDLLLTDTTAEARWQLARLFNNKHFLADDGKLRVPLLKRCAEDGLMEPYRFYLRMLEDTNPVVVVTFTTELVTMFAADDLGIKEIIEKLPAPADQVEPMKEWLRAKLARWVAPPPREKR